MATLDELGAYLVTESVVTGIGPKGTAPRLFYDRLPDTPDYCMALIETGGTAPDMGYGIAGIQFEKPGVQMVTRGVKDDAQTPRTLIQSGFSKFSEIRAEALSGTTYLTVLPSQSPFSLTPDEKGRPRFSVNFAIDKEPT